MGGQIKNTAHESRSAVKKRQTFKDPTDVGRPRAPSSWHSGGYHARDVGRIGTRLRLPNQPETACRELCCTENTTSRGNAAYTKTPPDAVLKSALKKPNQLR